MIATLLKLLLEVITPWRYLRRVRYRNVCCISVQIGENVAREARGKEKYIYIEKIREEECCYLVDKTRGYGKADVWGEILE